MPEINIDEICEPIKLTVNKKTYTIDDISRETMAEIQKVTRAAQVAATKAEVAMKVAEESGEEVEIPVDHAADLAMAEILAKITGAEADDIKVLGVRKFNALLMQILGAVTAELAAKNVPGANVTT